MTDIRERFRVLDTLDVPDVMAQARRIGPRVPSPDAPPPNRRNAALAFAAVVAVIAAVLFARALDEPVDRPGDPPRPAHLPSTPQQWAVFPIETSDGGARVFALAAGGPGLVVAGADGGFLGPAAVWVSSDGRTWGSPVPNRLGKGYIETVAAGRRGLVALGLTQWEFPGDPVVWISHDGIAWNRTTGTKVSGTVVATRRGFVAIDGEIAWFSSDGSHWERALSPPHDPDARWTSMSELAVTDDRLVAIGTSRRFSIHANRIVVWTSVDGRSWTDVPIDDETFPFGAEITSVAHGPGGFVAVGSIDGQPSVWISVDGSSWNRMSDEEAFVSRGPARPDAGSYVEVSSVAGNEDGYVAAGADRACSPEHGRCFGEAAIWVSADGAVWFRVEPDRVFRSAQGHPYPVEDASVSQVVAWGRRFAALGEANGGYVVWISDPRND